MTRAYNIHEAKTHFSKLVAAVERGERGTICRNGEPVIECVPVERLEANLHHARTTAGVEGRHARRGAGRDGASVVNARRG